MSEGMNSGELAAALSKFQGEMTAVPKTKTANAGSYSYAYADLGDIVAAAYPIMAKHGLAFLAKPTLNADGHLVLVYKLMHESGEFEGGEYPLPADGTPQQVGSAITYARRYAFCAITGAVSEEDDDGKAASQEREPTSRPRQARKAAEPDEGAQRRRYHKLRERLGWDEDAGHDFINDLSGGRSTRWTDIPNADARSAVLEEMQRRVGNLGPNFPVNTETGEVPPEES